ncbi:MAG: hypothetical protein LBL62_05320 [Planctomycetaceae bacterium]|nr:hypothetical protein [Planctomycetaceae bacterium]
MNQINDDKWCCFPFWSRVRLHRRDRPAGGSPTSTMRNETYCFRSHNYSLLLDRILVLR